jgi:predicted nucleic acid-binding Zn ribbon protein
VSGERTPSEDDGARTPPGTEDVPEPTPDDAARAALARARAAARERGLRPSASGSRNRRGVRTTRGSQPYTPGRDPQPVLTGLERLVGERGWSQSLAVAGVVGRWREVVGDQVADHCSPETFENGSLVVRADSTAWAQQVRLLVPHLQRRLADEVGEGVVEAITVLGPAGPTWVKGPRNVPGRGPRDTYG